jgi:hypothetical protein
METEHKEGVVEQAVAYVKDLFGIRPADETPVEGKPYTPTDEPEGVFTNGEAMQKYPDEQIPETAHDLNAHGAREEDGE